MVVDEGLVALGELVERPQAASQLAGIALAADVEVLGGGDDQRVGDAEPLGLGDDVVLPLVGRHVEPVVDAGAAEGQQVVAQGVPRGPLGLGDGEGDEVPVPVPAPAGVVLGVGEPGALEVAATAPGRRRRSACRSRSRPRPDALEQPFGDEAPQADADLVGRQPAGGGDAEAARRRRWCRRRGPCRTPAPWSEPVRSWRPRPDGTDGYSCRPHSVLARPAQRPERGSSGSVGSVVHGSQPIDV